MKHILRLLTFISLIVLFLSGSFYTTDTLRHLQPFMLVGSMALLLAIFSMHMFPTMKVDLKLFSVYMMFFVISIVSAATNASPYLVIGAFAMIYIYVGASIILPAIFYSNVQNGNKIIAQSIVIGHIPIFIYPMLIEGITLTSYKGIFYNPNSFGGVAATLFAAALPKTAFIIEDYVINGNELDKKAFVLQLLFLIALFVLIVISSSRTSFVTSIALVVVVFFFLLVKAVIKANISLRPMKKVLVIVCVFILLAVVACYTTELGALIENSIAKKFVAKSADPLDGRLYVWTKTIRETKILGHGREYFGEIGLAAHNTFISLLGQYGFLAALLFIVFLILHTIKCIRYAYKNMDDTYKYLPLLAVVNFILLSLAEGVLFLPCMLLLFCTIGTINLDSLNGIEGQADGSSPSTTATPNKRYCKKSVRRTEYL